jgi:hypothetical protein
LDVGDRLILHDDHPQGTSHQALCGAGPLSTLSEIRFEGTTTDTGIKQEGHRISVSLGAEHWVH